MKKIGLTIIAACFISGLIVASASAQMSGGRGGGKKGMGGGGMGMCDGAHVMHVISALGLDDNQSKEVKSVLLKLQKELIQKRANIQVAEIELSEIIGNDTVDIKVAETKVKQIASLKTEAAMMHIQGIEDVKAKLTPEQKKKLSEMMQVRHGKGMMDCPMMKGMMDMEADTGVADVKHKTHKAVHPEHQHNQ
ncbi:MAG: periplasmic heavy metal sensor [Pseudomonadota bacterium]